MNGLHTMRPGYQPFKLADVLVYLRQKYLVLVRTETALYSGPNTFEELFASFFVDGAIRVYP